MKSVFGVIATGLVAALMIGCGSGGGDVGPANTEKVNATEAAAKQQGAGGKKEAMGGGLADMNVAPAPAGVKTGPPTGGQK